MVPILISPLFWFIPSGSLFQSFMPRSVCMFHEDRLIALHAITDSVIFLSYFIISTRLFKIYRVVEQRQFPFRGFLWMFGIFIFFCGLTHAIGVLNLSVTFYWLDGLVKAICAIFSIITALLFYKIPEVLSNLHTQEEHQHQQEEIDKLRDRITLLEKGTI